jgi:hypothetical protein
MHPYSTRSRPTAVMWARIPKLPPEILHSILGYVDGDLHTFASMCLTNKQFHTWAIFETLKWWPHLQEDLRRLGGRSCAACDRILAPKRWVELGPGYWTYEISCITCRIRELGTSGPYFDKIRRNQQADPACRPCLCCMSDYGGKRRALVRQKLDNNGVFCECCMARMRPELGELRMQELALQCKRKYLEMLASG